MKSRSKALAAGCAAALASILAPATASATGFCYAFTDPSYNTDTVDGGPPIVLRYIPKSVGPLTTDTESYQLNHLKQIMYSLAGKVTAILARCVEGVQSCPDNADQLYQTRLMTTLDGTLITGKRLSGTDPVDAQGAHMGMNIHILRRIPEVAGPYPIGPGTLECTTDQVSVAPNYWRCNLRADVSVPFQWVIPVFQPIILRKVNPTETPACSVFQDGEPEIQEPI
jgi:hypothetical protein